MEKRSKHSNRLIRETSPYLLQHAHNPVDWYPWGEEALNRARKENKPILLSIGYSSCHWCHVMERESFENEAVAKIMNDRFISIKVDREERPDLDEIYMNAIQMMTGSGGWPMTVFLTPDLVPFHGGTYFPPEDRGGMPGFSKVLIAVSDYYRTHEEEVGKVTEQMRSALHQIAEIASAGKSLVRKPSGRESSDEKILSNAYESLERQFDPHHGGFGGAPKFPSSMALSFLLRYWKRTGNEKALEMVRLTLEKMADGGIYDHLGGGFHRYSVDDHWLIPHFEKMLYDNALLSRTYFEAFQATRRERFRQVGEEILDYVLRDMTSPQGGFYSTEDADSEGREGKFYVWRRDRIEEILGKEEGAAFSSYYGATPGGNFEEGESILHIDSSFEEVSGSCGISIPRLKSLIEKGRKRLFSEREKRVRPGRDDKILTSWNGLMISGFVAGYKATGDEKYLNAAKKAARFILEEMRKDGLLVRVFAGGKSRLKGYSEDYAFFIQALIDLYEATFEMDWLREANDLNETMIRQFWDEGDGGFFFSGKENEVLVARSKSPYDNAVPSSNSVAVFNLLKLGHLTGEDSLKEKAEKILRLFSKFLSEHPSGFSQMLSGFSFFLGPEEVGIVGSRDDSPTRSMAREVHLSYLPDSILSFRDLKEPTDGDWLPFLRNVKVAGAPAVFVCRNFTCLPPARDEEELRRVLSASSP